MNNTKSFKFELKEVSDEGKFDGYASTFGNIDLGGDIVASGAFAQTIKTNGGIVPILDSHDPSKQIGWNHTAKEDRRGLKVSGELDLNVQGAREKHSLMLSAKEIGAKMGLSIGYRTIKSEPHKTKPEIRVLKEVELLEYSVVAFPMNPKARVTNVKQIDGVDVEKIYDHLTNELGITQETALFAIDQLKSRQSFEQIDIDHSEEEQADIDHSEIYESMKAFKDLLKNSKLLQLN